MENINSATNFKSVIGFSAAFFGAEEVGFAVSCDPEAAFLGLVEVLARQTQDERATKGTSHKNKFGFSKKHVTRGTALAIKFLGGEELTSEDVEDACDIAVAYRQQLWMIALGAVPVNNLDLGRRRSA